MQEGRPRLRSYQDYRSFLRDFTDFARKKNPRWSYGIWSRRLGLKSKSPLVMAIQGKRGLSPRLTENLIRYFEFAPADALYFRRLVAIEAKEKTTVHQVKAEDAILEVQRQPTPVEERLLEKSWLAFVIKEAAAALGKDATPERISEAILSKPAPQEVKSMLDSLVDVGYLSQENAASKDSPRLAWSRETLEKLHVDSLRASESACRDLPPDERVFQTSFVRVRKERLAEARILMRAFQREFTREMEVEDGDEVFQLNLHFFPLTDGLTKT